MKPEVKKNVTVLNLGLHCTNTLPYDITINGMNTFCKSVKEEQITLIMPVLNRAIVWEKGFFI